MRASMAPVCRFLRASAANPSESPQGGPAAFWRENGPVASAVRAVRDRAVCWPNDSSPYSRTRLLLIGPRRRLVDPEIREVLVHQFDGHRLDALDPRLVGDDG